MSSSRSRRKSQGGGGPPAKAAKIEDFMSPKTSSASQPVILLREWLQTKASTHNDMHAYFADKFSTQEALKEFLTWMDTAFPDELEGRQFASYADFRVDAQGVFLRPWMLTYQQDAGLKGYVEPDQLLMIAELIVVQGFQTDPNIGGTEKLLVGLPPDGMMTKRTSLTAADVSPCNQQNVINPGGLMLVKGWTRSFAAMSVMLACYEVAELYEAMTPAVRASFGVVHGTTRMMAGRDQVLNLIVHNRGMTLQSTSTRRKPNAFNLCHQMRLMSLDQVDEFEEVWQDAASLQSAYSLGEKESTAAFNLLREIDADAVQCLNKLVQKYSMSKFITHDALAGGFLNTSFNGGTGSLSPWDRELQNTPEIVGLVVQRLASDYEKASPKMRKTWTGKDLETLQRVCAAWIAALEVLQTKVPEQFLEEERSNLHSAFMHKHCDADLEHILSSSVPPLQVDMVSNLRTVLFRYQRSVDESREKEMQQLTDQLQYMSSKQSLAKMDADIEKLNVWSREQQEHNNREGHFDVRYLHERFQRGKGKVADFMKANHVFLPCDNLQQAQADILKYQHSFADGAPPITLMILDVTSWPTRGGLLDEAIDTAGSLANGNENAALLVLTPVVHSNVAQHAIIKKRRRLEDKLFASLEITELSLNFADQSHGADKRRRSQLCFLGTSSVHQKTAWSKSKAFLGLIGPIDRARVSDMQNPDDKPLTPAHRVMQKGISGTKQILECLLDGLGLANDQPVMLIDFLPTRFGEWGMAAWSLQKQVLDGTPGPAFHFMGMLPSENDDEFTHRLPNLMSGKILQEWWDNTAEAGPKRRSAVPFATPRPTPDILTVVGTQLQIPEAVADGFRGADPAIIRLFEDVKVKVNTWNETVSDPLPAAGPTKSSDPATTPPRTSCRPIFGPGEVVELSRTHVFSEDCVMTMEALAADHEFLGAATTACNSDVKIHVTKDFQIYLCNTSDTDLRMSPGELFGFGLGSFSEKLAGVARSSGKDSVAWLLNTDADMVVCAGADGKKVMPLAEVVCGAARDSGIMEIQVTDYDLAQAVQADGTAKDFRYTLNAKSKINCFTPKALEEKDCQDILNLRHTMFGALFVGNLNKVPRTTNVRVLWEVSVERSVPVQIRPRKPKCRSLCHFQLKAKHAHQIKV